ncbi:ABC transporter substrate-binding protein [Kitasatospora sp. NPDC048540]|uniref:ABC transporter substrate-binding protein n=1 Tax=unclassified Kitasatospora TaxID=2633591 RepID=UPI00068F076F|nr:ABC transporter substrate-binding protein [Kitasatospora sp. MBT63]
MHHSARISGRFTRSGAALAAGSLLLTGCSSIGAAKSPEEELHDRLPDAVKTAGVLRIGSDVNYAPVEFKGQDGLPTGFDPDLAEAIGRQLKIKIKIMDTDFDKLIPDLQAKQFDVAMSALTDNRQRRDGTDDNGQQVNPGVDFVDYFLAGTTILVPKGNPKKIKSLDDLCGQTVAVQRGTTQAAIAQRQTGACDKAHKTLTITLTETDNDALALVASGKAVADMNDYPVAAYTVQKGFNGAQFEITGQQLQPSPYGLAVAKENAELRDTLAKAVNQIIRSGEYDKILEKWNLKDGAAQNAVVNGG